MKKIKKIFAAVLILSVLLSGCGIRKTSSQSTQENKPVSPANSASDTSFDTENSEEMKTALLYTTMNFGSSDFMFNELYPIKQFPTDVPYMGSAFYFAYSDGKGEEVIDEDTAMALMRDAMSARGENSSVIVQIGEEIIEGEHARSFSAGENSVDGKKYTAMYHYAVTDSGKVYYIDVLQGADWILLKN